MDREGNRRENVDTAPGRLTMRNVSLSSCIRWAYGVQGSQISGSGAATAPGSASEDQLKVKLQGLLGDRFKLTLESRKAPLEILVIDHAERVPSEN